MVSLTKRINLDLGFRCNANCKFCYYQNIRAKKSPCFEKLKQKLEFAKKLGMKSVEFTGGEPTIHKDLLKLISYAKQLGYKKIGIITNGIAFDKKGLAEDLEKAGLEEVKLSISAAKACIHDDITQTQNSFKHLIKGIKNIRRTKLKIKTNTVINKLNYKTLPEIAKFLVYIKPIRINFKFVTPILGAINLDKDVIVKYSEASPYLHRAIDLLKSKGYSPTIRYIPFCFMKGYEEYVCNLCQVQYDPDEWDYLVKNRIEYGIIFSKLNQLFGYMNMIKRMYTLKKDISYRAVIESKLLRLTTKRKTCKTCKYDLICDGLWKNYAKLYGYSELKPIIDKKIKKPYTFMIR